MKIFIIQYRYLWILAVIFFHALSFSSSLAAENIVIEDFQSYRKTPFSNWKTRKNNRNKYKIYKIKKSGRNRYLEASTKYSTDSIQLGLPLNKYTKNKKHSWNIIKHPYLKWKWRVRSIPKGGNENIKKMNDSAAGIYVLFQSKKIPLVNWKYQPVNWIKYVWSSTLPVGTVIKRTIKKYGVTTRGRYVVVASGRKGLRTWRKVKRNVLLDYIRYYKTKPKYQPIMIGILTDSNATESLAEADYDQIVISKD